MPTGWAPTEQHRALAAELAVDLATEEAKFRDWSAATAKTYVEWDSAFSNWIRNARTYRPRNAAGGNGTAARGHLRVTGNEEFTGGDRPI